uniref:Rhodanese domain-containing protein n=1 Tax=viral metagenome TaxID=1070528 RepID=A0A6C0LGU7_9ZZZZ
MGNSYSIKKINFEDMQRFIKDTECTIINTMTIDRQGALISHTIDASKETSTINTLINTNLERKIVIYGENACDDGIVNKYNQLIKLGFSNVHIYPGGMFEWLLLQDIYGDDYFPTTKKCSDILAFKGKPFSDCLMIGY